MATKAVRPARCSLPALAASLAALLALLAGCHRDPGPGELGSSQQAGSAPGAEAGEPADPLRGKELVQAFECHRCHEGTGLYKMAQEKNCVGCHQDILGGRFKAPEATLARWQQSIVHLREAPSLGSTATRFRRAWLEGFLREPTKLRPHLADSMPRLAIDARDARDIAAYFIPEERGPGPLEGGDEAEGKRLLDRKGCGTCHAFTGATDIAPSDIAVKISLQALIRGMTYAPDLRFARERYQPGALVDWLRDPQAMKPDTPMPNLRLSEKEARDIARYLLTARLAPPVEPKVPARLALLTRPVSYEEVSKRIFRNTCWHCHAEPGYSLGDGGPGNSGGLGFKARGLNLAEYSGVSSGYLDDEGKRHSLFAPGPSGSPRLVEALLARQQEEAGHPVPGVRGMPLGLPALSPDEIQLVESWIAQGRHR